jgi:hypothetical protein
MNWARIGILAGIALLVVCTAFSQEAGWLDLTDLHPRERIRAPHAGSMECGGGAGFEPSLEASITLMYLDKASYSMGEEITFEVKVQNTGREAIEIPWTQHIGDLESAESSQPYTYLHAAISLNFTEPNSNRSFSIFANSYGSSDLAGTTRKLLPGQWIFIRGRQKLEAYEEWWWNKIKDSSPLTVKVSAGLMLDKVTYSPGAKSDSSMDRSVCIPLLTNLGASPDVALWPPRSQ